MAITNHAEARLTTQKLVLLAYGKQTVLVLSAGTVTNYMAKHPRLKPHEPGD